MVKRAFALCLLMACLLCAASALAVDAVNDLAGLYTDAEISRMETAIQRIRSTYQMDCVVLTTYDVPRGGDSVTVAYADKWYEDNGCGLGEDRAGVLMIVDMTNRYNYMSTAGVMIDYMSDARIEQVLSAADSYLSAGQWGSAMLAQLSRMEGYLQKGIEEGSFRYDEVTGQRLTGLYNKLTTGELVLALVCGGAAALILWSVVMGRYKLKGGTYRYSLTKNVDLDLQVNDEHFLRQTVTRTRIPQGGGGGGHGGGGHSGGSGVHVSSGGMSHGGGGHHF